MSKESASLLTVPARCAIAVMGKASIPGRAKTRLAPPLSLAEAAALNTVFLQDIAGNLALAGESADLAPYIAYGPPGSAPFFRQHLPASVGLIETWFPNFGDCLFAAIREQLACGHAAACVLNSDSPTLPTALLVRAAQLLAAPGDRAVLGPCVDGGYYFLGLKHAHRRLFENVDWSTERVAAQTRARAAEIELEVVELDAWYDVDDAAALRLLAGELLFDAPFRARGPRAHRAPCTRAALARLLDETDLAERLQLVPQAAEHLAV